MRYVDATVTMSEVPGEVSLAFTVSGCQLRCAGCHSPYLWNPRNGKLLTKEVLTEMMLRYQRDITCVLFMGGEWYSELVDLLDLVHQRGLRTALYTGEDSISEELMGRLDYVKLGPYDEKLGGLQTPTTNQKMIHVPTGTLMNHMFIFEE